MDMVKGYGIRKVRFLWIGILVLTFMGCKKPQPPPPPDQTFDPGLLRIFVDTVQFEGLTGLSLDVTRVDVIISPDPNVEGTLVTIADEPASVNLVGFLSATPKFAAQYVVPQEGFISQIRFVAESATAQMGPDTQPVKLPSGAQTGIKAIAAGTTIQIIDGVITDVTIKLDPEHSVLENLGQGLILKPVVKLLGGQVTSFPVNAFVPDQVTVLFTAAATPDAIAAAVASVGGAIIDQDPYFPPFVLIQLASGSDVLAAQNALNSLPIVQGAIPNFIFVPFAITHAGPAWIPTLARKIRAPATPNDPKFPLQWGLENTGQFAAGPDIDAPGAWDFETGTPTVVVAVIDSGIDRTHPDLAGNIWSNPGEIPGNGFDDDGNGYPDDVFGWNFVDNNPDTLDTTTEPCVINGEERFRAGGHGSNVAGVIGAVGNNGVGIAGVAWDVQIMALRVYSNQVPCGGWYYILRALRYARQNGAHIVNISIGGIQEGDAAAAALSFETQFAAEVGNLLVVAAAGNDGLNVDNDPRFHALAEVTHPQLVVAAWIDPNGNKADWSNAGVMSVDLVAPGGLILTTVRGGGFDYVNGTSFAAPHVAGVAALIKSRFPPLGPLQIRDRILNNVVVDQKYVGRVATGGLLNAKKAVQ